jgi:hypothetical protein
VDYYRIFCYIYASNLAEIQTETECADIAPEMVFS